MARSFATASDQYLLRDSAVLAARPIAMSCWFKCPAVPVAFHNLLTIANHGEVYSSYNLMIGTYPGMDTDKISAALNAGEGDIDWVASTTGWVPDTWHHAFCTFTNWGEGNLPRLTIYLDAGGATSKDSIINPTAVNRTGIGVFIYGPDGPVLGQNFCMNGLIAEAAIWNEEPTLAEIQSLARGYSPLLVRPQNLVAYWPLIRKGSEIDNRDILGGGYHLTDYSGPDDAEHCRIIRPSPPLSTAIKRIISIPVLMNHYRRMRAS